MTTISSMRATKPFKTGSAAITKVNEMGEKIDKYEPYITKGKQVLDVFGIGQDPATRDDAIMAELEQLHLDIETGFKDIENRIDELQLSNALSSMFTDIDFKYTRINELCNKYHSDRTTLDTELKQLLTSSLGVTIIEEMMMYIYQATDVMLGDAVWSVSVPSKSIGDIIHQTEVEKAGNERFEYLSAAVQYYSLCLASLYEGLFVVNFIQAYFDPNPAADAVSDYVTRASAYVDNAETRSPLTGYQYYFEMKMYVTRCPNTMNNNDHWFLMTCGEYLIYNLANDTIRDGPYRLGSTLGFAPPAGFRNIPAEFHYPHAVYSERTNPKRKVYDDYYYFFKGGKVLKLFWDGDKVIGTYDIRSHHPWVDGVAAAYQNPHNGETTLYKHLNTPSGLDVCGYKMSSRSWYDDYSPSYTAVILNKIDLVVEGGGVWPRDPTDMLTFSGRKWLKFSKSGAYITEGSLTSLFPGLTGSGSPWHIDELMDRDAPIGFFD